MTLSKNEQKSQPLTKASCERIEEAAQCLRVLAHPHRLHMVELLLDGEFSVGELAQACGIQPHVASEHLGLLKDRGMLARERRGRRIYYQIGQPALHGIIGCLRSHFGWNNSAEEQAGELTKVR